MFHLTDFYSFLLTPANRLVSLQRSQIWWVLVVTLVRRLTRTYNFWVYPKEKT